jgi:hypothetical protein
LPSLNTSAPGIDFHTAFGRLLRDGSLRDAHALNAQAVMEQMAVRERDRPPLLQLVPDDLEYQAEVLLRKRLDALRPLLPETIQWLGSETWPVFHHYARTHWPTGIHPVLHDAYDFGLHLRQGRAESLCETEWNRLEFVIKRRRAAIYLLRPMNGDKQRRRQQWRWQFLVGNVFGFKRRREIFFWFGF